MKYWSAVAQTVKLFGAPEIPELYYRRELMSIRVLLTIATVFCLASLVMVFVRVPDWIFWTSLVTALVAVAAEVHVEAKVRMSRENTHICDLDD